MRIKPFETYPQVTTTIAKLRYSKGGVYFLYNSNGLQYIGHSENVAQRVKTHPILRGLDRSLWTVVVTKIQDRVWRKYWELELIKKYTPPLNRQCNPLYEIINHHTYVLRRSEVFPD